MALEFGSALLTVFITPFFNKLVNVFLKELKERRGASNSLRNLEETVFAVQKSFAQVESFLLESREQSLLQRKIDDLNALCYDAEDLMEYIAFLIEEKSKWKVVKKLGISKLQMKLKETEGQLEEMLELVQKYPNKLVKENQQLYENVSYHDNIIGRDDDIKTIVQMLTSVPSDYNGVCVVGKPGVGKSALVSAIINEKCISDEFYILQPPVEDGKFNSATIKEVKSASESSQKALLIMLDNLLEVEAGDWDDFLSACIQKTKVILITTINASIPKYTNTIKYELKPLSEENCKQLIELKAKRHNSKLIEPRLKTLAGILAKESGGLPGVARILGVQLARYGEGEWITKLTHGLRDLPDELKKEIFPILLRSYKNMQPHVKRFVAYFSLFPLEHAYSVDDLLQLWVAEGFIQQDEGKPCFNNLNMRLILQDSGEVTVTKKRIYKLQKFDLQISKLIASDLYHQLDTSMSTSICNNTRHLSLLCNISNQLLQILKKSKHLRTVISLSKQEYCGTVKIPSDLFKELEYLRVLDLNGTNIDNLPDSIYKLKYLRYLDVSRTLLEDLPDDFCKLHKLQVLKITGTKRGIKIPPGFANLTNLQYVDWTVSDIRHLDFPANIGNLSHLQALPLFEVKRTDGYSIAQLQNMNNLQGAIQIKYLENVESKETAQAAQLCNKPFLETLGFEWIDWKDTTSSVAMDVLSGLEPHDYLKELKIRNYNSEEFPDWMFNSSRMLEEIHLHECKSCEVLPSLGELLLLKILILEDFTVLTSVDNLFGGPRTASEARFKSLESLTFKSLTRLQKWTVLQSNDLPSLTELVIIKCPELISLPSLAHLTSLEDLQIESCPALESMPNLPMSVKKILIKGLTELQEWGALQSNDLLSLTELIIDNCPQLINLPSIAHLTSLKNLLIESCPALISLPDLPESLKSLIIGESPSLKVGCLTEGQDRQKVDHILQVKIDDETIMTLAASSAAFHQQSENIVTKDDGNVRVDLDTGNLLEADQEFPDRRVKGIDNGTIMNLAALSVFPAALDQQSENIIIEDHDNVQVDPDSGNILETDQKFPDSKVKENSKGCFSFSRVKFLSKLCRPH